VRVTLLMSSQIKSGGGSRTVKDCKYFTCLPPPVVLSSCVVRPNVRDIISHAICDFGVRIVIASTLWRRCGCETVLENRCRFGRVPSTDAFYRASSSSSISSACARSHPRQRFALVLRE
jgi:hypothetical protein